MAIPVGGAFHTPYMNPARDRLRKALAEVSFREAEPVVTANVDARAHADPAEWPGLLSAQLCSPVRWRQSLAALYEAGARTFVELGPGGVLGGLAKRSLPSEDTATFSVATPDELERLVEALAGPQSPPAGIQVQVGERFAMTERLVVSPTTGPFTPAPDCLPMVPTLASGRDEAASGSSEPTTPIRIRVGDLVGWAGEAEIRSAFAGTLEGVLVLPGERVVSGQPVAWLRAAVEDEPTSAPKRPATQQARRAEPE
jgi:[acyl-carrier-protein] S-malonyltransferase